MRGWKPAGSASCTELAKDFPPPLGEGRVGGTGYSRCAMTKGRVEAFSDGVFAEAATLLIFNI